MLIYPRSGISFSLEMEFNQSNSCCCSAAAAARIIFCSFAPSCCCVPLKKKKKKLTAISLSFDLLFLLLLVVARCVLRCTRQQQYIKSRSSRRREKERKEHEESSKPKPLKGTYQKAARSYTSLSLSHVIDYASPSKEEEEEEKAPGSPSLDVERTNETRGVITFLSSLYTVSSTWPINCLLSYAAASISVFLYIYLSGPHHCCSARCALLCSALLCSAVRV